MTGKELYQIARKYLGKGGSTFRKFCGLASNAPYCCAYVCYIFFTNSLNKLFYGGKKVTYCPNAIKWCQANLAQLPLYMAMPMDIAFFDWNKNGIPDHIGFVKAKISSDRIQTHEGNTSGGIVAEKTRTVGYMMGGVFRPHYAPKGLKKEVLAVDGDFGYKSVYMLQVMLDVKADGILGKVTLKTFQKKLGVAPDASWGRKTTLAAQRFVGVKADGEWGPVSTRALQTYVNKKCFPSVSGNQTATKTPVVTATPSTAAVNAVAWARKIAASKKYTYKKWKNKVKATKLCPICHKLGSKFQGWNCIGFVSAAFFHGAGMKITCSCDGLGGDKFFTNVTESSWRARNGNCWNMISNGGSKGGSSIPASKLILGDAVICFNKSGKFKHIVLYTGNGKYIDCTNSSKNHIAERSYSNLCKKYHCTRAFRPK